MINLFVKDFENHFIFLSFHLFQGLHKNRHEFLTVFFFNFKFNFKYTETTYYTIKTYSHEHTGSQQPRLEKKNHSSWKKTDMKI